MALLPLKLYLIKHILILFLLFFVLTWFNTDFLGIKKNRKIKVKKSLIEMFTFNR